MATAVSTKETTKETPVERTRNVAVFTPPFDIWETDNELVLSGDLPGVAPEDLDIKFENGELTIYGRVQPRHEGVELLYSEYGIGDFERTFAIDESIDAAKISAELKGGVLTVHLPKSEQVRPRRIEVKAG